jgi:hypothetical protein
LGHLEIEFILIEIMFIAKDLIHKIFEIEADIAGLANSCVEN